jgi:hypothetical protein
MRKLRVGRPSPAMAVAIAALCVSLVGTAFAGPIAEISGLTKKDKQTVRKISRKISNRVSNRRITKRAPRLSVRHAQAADSATTAASATGAANADMLDGLDASAFLGQEQLFVSSAVGEAAEDHVLIAFPDLGFELRTTGAASVGYASTAPGDYFWSGYVNGAQVFNAQGPSGGVVANVALDEAGAFNRFAMVRREPDGSNVGVATADCFRMPSTFDEIACLGHSASSG